MTPEAVMAELKQPRYRYLARRMVGDLWWEDILQEVAIKCWLNGSELRSASIVTYLWRAVTNTCINLKRRKHFMVSFEDYMSSPARLHVQDFRESLRLRSYLYASRYQRKIASALSEVMRDLGPRESFILYMYYKKEERLVEIAKQLSSSWSRGKPLHQSNVTRQLQRTTKRISDQLRSKLEVSYGMSSDQVEECCADFVSNKFYMVSALDNIKDNF